MRRDTWNIVSSQSVSDKNMLPVTCFSSARGNLNGRSGNSSRDSV